MKVKRLFSLFLFAAILTVCVAIPACAEDIPSIDWSAYSYDDLIVIRKELDDHIKELERQYAIENGNRKIELGESDITVYKTDTVALNVNVKRVVEDAPENTELIWTSSDETVAKVSPAGIVTAVDYGDAVITCTASDDELISGEVSVHVVLPVTDITLDKPDIALLLSESNAAVEQTLKYAVEPENAYVQDVTWLSSDETIATVDANGTVHAVSPGTVTVTAVSNDTFGAQKSAACTVTVLQAVEGISLSEESLILNVRGNERLTAAVIPENASKKDVIWESTDSNVITVTPDGRISAVATGSAEIICTAADGSGAEARCKVTVIQMVNSLKIDAVSGTITLNRGKTTSLNVSVMPEDATNKNLTWKSSDTSVATVDENGNVTAVNGGSAVITCTAADGSEKTAEIKVYVPSIAVDSREYSVESKTGKEITFKYYGKPENLTYTPKNCAFFGVTMKLHGENVTLTISPEKAGTTSLTLVDKEDSRSNVTLKITVEHSACYDSTSYPVGNYTNIMRSPSEYKGEPMSIYGRVLQVSDGLFYKVLRVATRGRWDDVFYVTCLGNSADGIIEEDYITVYGECDGTETYKTIMGGSVTIPSIDAERIFLGRH